MGNSKLTATPMQNRIPSLQKRAKTAGKLKKRERELKSGARRDHFVSR
jgi:hypothetical protein